MIHKTINGKIISGETKRITTTHSNEDEIKRLLREISPLGRVGHNMYVKQNGYKSVLNITEIDRASLPKVVDILQNSPLEFSPG